MGVLTTREIAHALHLDEAEVQQQAMLAWLTEQKRQILQSRLEILARYRSASLEELETKIANGEVPEHPAWEDLIVAENLSDRLEEINAYLRRLQPAG
jgi:hypothetical protein